MERGGGSGRWKQQRHDEKKRSPLQDLNGHPICKTNRKKCSNPSFSDASASIEAHKGCLRLLMSSNSCSSSSASSSSKTLIEKKPRGFSKLGVNERKNSAVIASNLARRSEENEVPKKPKPSLQKSKRIQPQGVCKNPTRPLGKYGQKSKLSSASINPANKLNYCRGKAQFGMPNFNSAAESSTPVGKIAPLPNSDSKNFDIHKNIAEDSVNEGSSGKNSSDVKTPPVEASLSPEIQRQSNSKMLVLDSAATPVCYGAGHLVSGVTDNRKCRRRGSLRGGCERANLFNGERSEGRGRDSFVPLPAEASVRWLLSPCREEHGGDSPDRLEQVGMMNCCNELDKPDLLSLPSLLLCGNTPDLLSADSSYSGSGGVGSVACLMRNKNMVDSVRKATKFDAFLGSLNGADVSLVLSPSATFSNTLNCIGDDLVLSDGSLGSGNIIQTPNSDSCVEESRPEVNHSNTIGLELDSISETLRRVDLSLEMPKWDVAASDDPTKFQKNGDSISSWTSESLLDTVALSQMKISWRDGLVSRNDEQTDEFDCCCLSDEEINAGKSPKEGKQMENEGNDSGRDMDISPILSEYEPCVSARGKEKLLSRVPDTCAESICTDGGGLVASGDSDWTYSLDNHFFQVK